MGGVILLSGAPIFGPATYSLRSKKNQEVVLHNKKKVELFSRGWRTRANTKLQKQNICHESDVLQLRIVRLLFCYVEPLFV